MNLHVYSFQISVQAGSRLFHVARLNVRKLFSSFWLPGLLSLKYEIGSFGRLRETYTV